MALDCIGDARTAKATICSRRKFGQSQNGPMVGYNANISRKAAYRSVANACSRL